MGWGVGHRLEDPPTHSTRTQHHPSHRPHPPSARTEPTPTGHSSGRGASPSTFEQWCDSQAALSPPHPKITSPPLFLPPPAPPPPPPFLRPRDDDGPLHQHSADWGRHVRHCLQRVHEGWPRRHQRGAHCAEANSAGGRGRRGALHGHSGDFVAQGIVAPQRGYAQGRHLRREPAVFGFRVPGPGPEALHGQLQGGAGLAPGQGRYRGVWERGGWERGGWGMGVVCVLVG